MANWSNFYLVRIEFLGFRYHGWQIQPDVKSVEGMIVKTIPFVTGNENFKVLGCGRTDAKVSAEDFVFELFLNETLEETKFLADFNSNLPFDIRAKSIVPTTAEFNIIQHPKTKEYRYNFSIGEKSHPFNAPYVINLTEDIDIEQMKKGAQLFEGTHNFRRFTTKSKENSDFTRTIDHSSIAENTSYQGSFFPSKVYSYQVVSRGFLTYQVRMMMSALMELGKGNLTIHELQNYLDNPKGEPLNSIAPSSGLVLHNVTL